MGLKLEEIKNLIKEAIPDAEIAIEDLAGGLYNEVSNNYSFSIGKHIQKIISEEHNDSLRLYVGGKISNAERLIIDNHSDNGINLELHIIDN